MHGTCFEPQKPLLRQVPERLARDRLLHPRHARDCRHLRVAVARRMRRAVAAARPGPRGALCCGARGGSRGGGCRALGPCTGPTFDQCRASERPLSTTAPRQTAGDGCFQIMRGGQGQLRQRERGSTHQARFNSNNSAAEQEKHMAHDCLIVCWARRECYFAPFLCNSSVAARRVSYSKQL